ncbi:hypothetical protein KXT74_24665, partial [Salmonella enterica subsp. enterica serovar Weltevreden]|nr:hypothetical protein [Salmonella enterica subsp. enterica serovar Weltevreden]
GDSPCPLVQKGELGLSKHLVADTASKKKKTCQCFCSNSGSIWGFSTIRSVFFLSHFCSLKVLFKPPENSIKKIAVQALVLETTLS